MNKPITRDTLASQIPSHILENYPNFFNFLDGYYEWLNVAGNPYERIKNHLSYLNFEQSLSDYIDFLKKSYLEDIPDNVLLDKELFIKWSKRFNLARGSRASYKFLFNVLYNDNNTEFYLPKNNILRTSDGQWISGEYKIIITNQTGSIDKFNYAQIVQTRELTSGYFEYAYGIVQSAKNRYQGRYNVIELTVQNIQGTFKKDYPITTQYGASEWIIDTVESITINTQGTGYKNGSKVIFDSLGDYVVQRVSTTTNQFDTRVTTFFEASDLTLTVNGTQRTNFTYDGQFVYSPYIKSGDTVQVTMPAFAGYMITDSVDSQTGAVGQVKILETPIGIQSNYSLQVDSTIGTGFLGTTVQGLNTPIDGYYVDNKGQLSSTMYLQDSYYYQEYSYALRTSQSLEKYGDIIKETLHPAGFRMFGYLRVIDLIEMLLVFSGDEYYVHNQVTSDIIKYGLGANYSFFERFKARLSGRLYKINSFIDKSTASPMFRFSLESALGTFYSNDNDYNLVSERSLATNGDPSWMTKSNLSDYFLYIPQDYTLETESGFNYFETGYVSERT